MKIGKKISAVILALFLSISCGSVAVYASDGNITFSDPETAVGEMVDIKCAVRSTAGNISKVEMTLSYDSDSLRFESGEGVTKEEDGTLSFQDAGGSSEIAFVMQFQALKEGSASVSISSATVSSGDGSAMTMEEGNSSVSIAAGDPSKIKEDGESDEGGSKKKKKKKSGKVEDMQVTIGENSYTLTDDFADADIPAGYAKTTITLEGGERQMVTNEAENIYLGYLRDPKDVGDFYIYNQENATFSPYEEVPISDTTSIIVLSDTSKVKLPDTYKKAGLTLNDKEFPVWQDNEHEGYYVMYAMNNKGETGYYQYDSEEGTYQRIEIAAAAKTETKKSSGLAGKITDFLDRHFQIAAIIAGVLGLIILIIIIVLAVKLRNRNIELDDLYDEYGIDPEDDEPQVMERENKKEKKPLFGHRKDDDEDDFDEDDFDDDDDFEDEDDFKETGLNVRRVRPDEDDFEEDFEEDDLEEDDIFSDKKLERYDTKTIRESMVIGDIDDRGDLDDLLEDLSGKRPGHQEDDDAFKVDFVDLD